MLRLPPFEYRRVGSAVEAAEILAGEGPEARLVAGGTDLWPNMKRRHQMAKTVVGLHNIPELLGVQMNGELRVGAMTTLANTAADQELRQGFPALAEAIESISSPPLRNMGTLGGNLCVDTRCTYYNQTEHWRQSIDYCMKAEGTVCWVAPSSPRCWAHAASDAAPMLCALGARIRLVSKDGDRVIPLASLYKDDGIEYLTRRHDEVLTDVLVPASASVNNGCRSAFFKLRRRGSIDFAVLSVAAALWPDSSGNIERLSLWLGAVASAPVEVNLGDLAGQTLNDEVIADIASRARKAATPMDNTDFRTQWRGQMVAVHTEDVLRRLVL